MKKWNRVSSFALLALGIALLCFSAGCGLFAPKIEKEVRDAIAKVAAPYSLTVGKIETASSGKIVLLHDVVLKLTIDNEVAEESSAKRIELEGLNLDAFSAPEKGPLAAKVRIFDFRRSLAGGYTEQAENITFEELTGNYAAMFTAWTKFAPAVNNVLRGLAQTPMKDLFTRFEDTGFWMRLAGLDDASSVIAYLQSQKDFKAAKYATQNYAGKVTIGQQPLTIALDSLTVSDFRTMSSGPVSYKNVVVGFTDYTKVTFASIDADSAIAPDNIKKLMQYMKKREGGTMQLTMQEKQGAVNNMRLSGIAFYYGVVTPEASPQFTIKQMRLNTSSASDTEHTALFGLDSLAIKREKLPPAIALTGLATSLLPEELVFSGNLDITGTDLGAGTLKVAMKDLSLSLDKLTDIAMSGLWTFTPADIKTGGLTQGLTLSFTDRGALDVLFASLAQKRQSTPASERSKAIAAVELRASRLLVRGGFESSAALMENIAGLLSERGTVRMTMVPKEPISQTTMKQALQQHGDAMLGMSSSFTPLK